MKRFLCLIFLFLTFFVMSCSSNANKPRINPTHYITSNLVGDYDVSDELPITIYYGTVLTKVKSEPENLTAKIMILNTKDIPGATEATFNDLYDHPENYYFLELIATLEDFCYENYPLNIIKKKRIMFFNCSYKYTYDTYDATSSINYIIPSSLFIDESGIIWLLITTKNIQWVKSYKYTINENIISIKEGWQ